MENLDELHLIWLLTLILTLEWTLNWSLIIIMDSRIMICVWKHLMMFRNDFGYLNLRNVTKSLSWNKFETGDAPKLLFTKSNFETAEYASYPRQWSDIFFIEGTSLRCRLLSWLLHNSFLLRFSAPIHQNSKIFFKTILNTDTQN